MVTKSTDVIGLKVITFKDGKEIEDVDDVVYDPVENNVRAFIVDKGGFFKDPKVLLLEDIRKVGRDAVLIESEEVLRNPLDTSKDVSDITRGSTYLSKTKVITDQGNELGHVSDIYFDTDTGNVSEIEVSQGGLKDLRVGKKRIKVEDIETVGEDVIIVRESEALLEKKVDEKLENVEDNLSEDEIKKRLDLAKNRMSDFASKAQMKAKDVSGKTQDAIEDIWYDKKTQQTLELLRMRANEARNTLQSKIKDFREIIDQRRRKGAIGKYLTKNILLTSDNFLAKRGELVTYKLLEKAREEGVEDQVLNNLSNEPV